MLVPRTRFGESLYIVPLLLALRFFYHAKPFEGAIQPVIHPRKERDEPRFNYPVVPASLPRLAFSPSQSSTPPTEPPTKLSTHDWLAQLSTSSANHRVISLTWTKSLSSPLSHEFVQFITEDAVTGTRSRHLTHRHVDGGDTVILNCDVKSSIEAKETQRFGLPLPLLSLTFPPSHALATIELARLLVSITARSPSYSLLREMCWWHAEAVFEGAHGRWGGEVREWEFGHLRYSFVVRTRVVRREKLIRSAEVFRRGCVREMRY